MLAGQPELHLIPSAVHRVVQRAARCNRAFRQLPDAARETVSTHAVLILLRMLFVADQPVHPLIRHADLEIVAAGMHCVEQRTLIELGHELGVEVTVESLCATFAAVPTVPDPTKRRLG